MGATAPLPDAMAIPLAEMDISDPRLLEQDAWRPFFARLRREDPVHFQAASPFGPFWSITCFEDIVAVDSDYEAFSSEPVIFIGDRPPIHPSPISSQWTRRNTICSAAPSSPWSPRRTSPRWKA